jgi:hypothetical protein
MLAQAYAQLEDHDPGSMSRAREYVAEEPTAFPQAMALAHFFAIPRTQVAT